MKLISLGILVALLVTTWRTTTWADGTCRLVRCNTGESTVAIYDIESKQEVDRLTVSALPLPLTVDAENDGYFRVKVGNKAVWLEAFDFETTGCDHKGGQALVEPGRPGHETLGTRGLRTGKEKK